MDVEKIVSVIDSGGLVVMPTDTVYGIMGDATNIEVIRKVYESKMRSYSKPLILLMDSYEMIKEYTANITELEDGIIKKYLPGAVTIILEKNEKVSNLITANSRYVGVRIPDNNELLEIIGKLGRPIISTSANISEEKTITNVEMLEDSLKEKIDYIYDGGFVNEAASTIVKVQDNMVKILREGKVASDLRNFIR